MNCERFEELLIDFMDNEIEPSEREMVKKHLMTCSHCSEKLEEFQEIRRRFNKESLPQPSPQVLATISKRARQEVAKDKVSLLEEVVLFTYFSPGSELCPSTFCVDLLWTKEYRLLSW